MYERFTERGNPDRALTSSSDAKTSRRSRSPLRALGELAVGAVGEALLLVPTGGPLRPRR
jgi:hypothetical protein